MDVSRLGVESELQLLPYTTATVRPDLSRVFDLHHSHSNARSKPHLRPMPQLTATPDQIFSFFFLHLSFRAADVAYEGSQARVKLELQLLAYTTAAVMPDLSRVFDLYHSSRQRQILHPLIKARD